MRFFSALAVCLVWASTSLALVRVGGGTSGFEKNSGQIVDQFGKANTSVLYQLAQPDRNISLTKDGFQYTLFQGEQAILPNVGGKQALLQAQSSRSYAYHRVEFHLLNINPNFTHRLLSGAKWDKSMWLPGKQEAIPLETGEKVLYENIYPNIDIEYAFSAEKGFKYNFIIHPGGRLDDIVLEIAGSQYTKVAEGNLILETSLGEIREYIPFSYQEHFQKTGELSQKKSVDACFRQIGPNQFGIQLLSQYESDKALVIDPVPDRLWGTYFGGITTELNYDLKLDGAGNIIIAGSTSSPANIATSGAFQGTFVGSTNGYIAKFNASGQRIWATYFGGLGSTAITGVAIGSNDDIYFTGTTFSDGLATSGVYQTTNAGGGDVMVGRFSSNGNRIWTSYLGGTGSDQALGCAIDGVGNLIAVGSTGSSTGMATAGSFQPFKRNSFDAFIASFSATGGINWSTYYGGANSDGATAVVAGGGKIFVSGNTESDDNISTSGSAQSTYGGKADGFWVRFSTSGVREYATYVGGSEYDNLSSIAVDANGGVAVAGVTQSTSGISTTGVHQVNFNNGFDAFVVRYNNAGVRQWGTYYGGNNSDEATSVAIAASGQIFVAGLTNSWGQATSNAHQTSPAGGFDAFILKLNSNGIRSWSTYYGGSANESNTCVALGPSGTIYLSGYTSSLTNIATTGVHQSSLGGVSDAYLVRLADCTPLPTPTVTASGPTSFCAGGSVTLTASGSGSGVNYIWSNGATGSNISVNQTGEYFAYASSSTCTSMPSSITNVQVLNTPIIGSFTPSAGAVGANITIQGDNLLNVSQVAFNGTAATFSVQSQTQISATVPAGATTGIITVSNGTCQASSGTAFTVNATTTPTISTGSVTRTLCQGTALSVPFTATGTFNSGNIFTAQLSNASGSFSSPINIGSGTTSPIACTIPANTTVGNGYRIRVIASNPSVVGTANSNGSITIHNQPVINSFTPVSAAVGATVTVNGTGLAQVNAATLGGISATLLSVSATTVQVTVPSGFNGGNIILNNGGCSATSTGVLQLEQPVVTSITVAPLPQTNLCAGNTVTINFSTQGTFNSNNTFRVLLSSPTGGFSSPTILASGFTTSPVTVTIPADATPGTNYGLRVVALSPFTSGNDLTGLTIIRPPVINSFTPAEASPGTLVRVLGANFNTVQRVWLANVEVGFTTLNDGEIQFTVPAGFTGGFIRLSTGVEACEAVSSTPLALPVVLSITTGPVNSNICTESVVEVPFSTTGNFPAGTVFTVQRSSASGSFASPVNMGSGTSSPISINIPASLAAGSGYRFRVVANTPSVTGEPNSNGAINIVRTPTISSFTPTSAIPGSTITVNGTNFQTNSLVALAGTSVSFNRLSSTQITFTIPTQANSGVITVANNQCSTSSTGILTVLPPNPGTMGNVALAKNVYCQGESISITYTHTGVFGQANVFTAQLSDVNGNFDNAVLLGTATSGNQISAVIPAGTPPGNGYRIRVISSSPVSVSALSEALTVNAAPEITAVSSQIIYENESFTVDGNGLGSTTQVTINGLSATFSIFSNNRLRVNTPAGVSSGPLVVQAGGCINLSNIEMTVPFVQTVRLINAASNAVIQNIVQGANINTSVNTLNIEAITQPARVGSVTFELSGPVSRTFNDGWNVYTLCGDAGTLENPNYNACNPALLPGSYTLTVTPRKFGINDNRTGRPLTLNFTLSANGSVRWATDELAESPATELKVFPNPINEQSTVQIHLEKELEYSQLGIYDGQGRQIATIHNGALSAGMHRFHLPKLNLASGIYAVRLSSAKCKMSQIMVVP